MKYIHSLIALLLIAGQACGAAYVSTATGNWSDQTKWRLNPSDGSDGNDGYPGDGDTATINHAVTVTADQTVGSSPADQTTMVLTIGSAGKLTIAAAVALTVRGNVYNNAGSSGAPANGIEWGAGSSLIMDGSQASNQAYVLKGGQFAKYYARGTSGSHALMNSLSGAGLAKFTLESANHGNTFDAEYLDFARLGDDSNKALVSIARTGNYSTSTIFKFCTWDACGATDFGLYDSGATVSLQDCSVTNSAETGTHAAQFNGKVGNTTSEITRCVFTCPVIFNPAAGFTVTSSYFHNKISIAGGSIASETAIRSFEGNFVRWPTASANNWDGGATDSYWSSDGAVVNISFLNWNALYAARTIQGCLFDSTGTNSAGDIIFPYGHATAASLTFTNNLFLPNASGVSSGKLLSLFTRYSTGTARPNGANPCVVTGTSTTWTAANGIKAGDAFKTTADGTWVTIASVDSATQITLTAAYPSGDPGSAVAYEIDTGSLTRLVCDHNTVCSVSYGRQSETGIIGIGEGDRGFTGNITSFKSNIAFTPSGKTGGFKLVRQQSNKQDIASASACDYNWGSGLDAGDESGFNSDGYYCWTDYRTAAMFSTGTPDSHGGNGDPGFVDPTRNMVLYDSAATGLNNSATAWSGASVEYSVGEIVSNSDAAYFGDATINYRCIVAHTSGASTEPGVGASWRTNWEPATLFRLRSDPTLIPTMIAWVKAGFAPTNSTLKNAGHDGVTIGAVEGVFGDLLKAHHGGMLAM